MRVAILGAGAIGAAFATHLGRAGVRTSLLGTEYDAAVLERVRAGEPHPATGTHLPDAVEVVDAGSWSLTSADVVLLAVSGQGVAATVRRARSGVSPTAVWAVASKGWDHGSLRHAARIVADEVGDEGRVVAVAGPSLASELAAGVPTNLVCAGWALGAARRVAGVLSGGALRVEVTDDVDGVAVGSVVKNVAAVAVGICDGLAPGGSMNTKAALFSIALREMADLTLAVGGRLETVLGPAGAGDLYVTCIGGRNARFGALVGAGMSAEVAIEEIAATVEGYTNARTVVALADSLGLALPLMRTVADVLLGGAPPATVIDRLVRGS